MRQTYYRIIRDEVNQGNVASTEVVGLANQLDAIWDIFFALAVDVNTKEKEKCCDYVCKWINKLLIEIEREEGMQG